GRSWHRCGSGRAGWPAGPADPRPRQTRRPGRPRGEHMFEPDAEAMPPDQREQLQLGRLRALADRLLSLGGVQAERLRAAGVHGGSDVTTLADLPRLPMTVKSDLWEAYPFGMVGVPAADVAAVHGSSGTGGRPTLVAYTRADLALWARMCARALEAAGATR